MRRLADPRDQVEARRAEGVLVERRLELGPGRALLGPGVDRRHPGRSLDRAATASSFDSSVTTMLVGALAPAGKLFSTSSWPSTESTSSRKPLPEVRSLLSWVSPRQSTQQQQRRADPDPPRPAVRPSAAMRLQKPCVSSMPSVPTRGMNGQNALRPVIASSAGRMVSIETIAMPTPSAPIGPRPGGAGDLGERERQQRGHDGRGRRRRSRGSPCASPRAPRRACPRGGAAPRGICETSSSA